MQKIYMRSMGRYWSFIKLMLLLTVMVGMGVKGLGQVAGDFQTRGTTGNWSDFTAWNIRNATNTAWIAATSGQIPSVTTDVFIQAAHTITIDNSLAVCKTIDASAATSSKISFLLASSILSVNGDLIFAGTSHNIFLTWAAGAKFVFTGNASQATKFLSNSSTFVNLEINKSDNSVITDGDLKFSTLLNVISGTLITASGRDIQGTSIISNITIQSSGTITQSGGAGLFRAGNSGSSPIGNVTISGTLNINTSTSLSAINTTTLTIEDNGATGGTVNVNFTTTGGVIAAASGGITIENNASLNIASTCNTTWVAVSTLLTLQVGGNLNISNTSLALPLAYIFLGTVNYNNGTQTIAAATSYANLTLTSISSPANKSFTTGLTVNKNLLISGNAVLIGSSSLINLGGNWTNYATEGFTESTSTVDFNGAGDQSITTTGGDDFFLIRKSGSGTLTLNSNLATAGGGIAGLNISNGIFDAGTNTLSGTSGTTLTMTGGTLKLGKLSTTLPEFIGMYELLGGCIELNGAGAQSFKGSESYINLTFSNSGTKTLSGSINPPTNMITGTITVANSAVLDATSKTMGGAGTNITMTGTSIYKTAGTGTKPDAQGTYSLGPGTTIEFSNTATTEEDIRLSPSYANIVVSGSSVANPSLASTPLNIQSGGSFIVASTGIFKHMNVNGFSGAGNTAISTTNNTSIDLQDGSTVEYYRNDGTTQTISNGSNIGQGITGNYYSLKLSGSGNKTAPAGTLEIKGNIIDSANANFLHNNGTVLLNGNFGQSFKNVSGSQFIAYNLSNNSALAGGGFTINNSLSVLKQLKLNTLSGLKLNTGDMVLKSSDTLTVNVAAIPLGEPNIIQYTGVGRFSIERYLKARSSWRFLATPVEIASSPSISSSWREGEAIGINTATGFGTRITGPVGMDEVTRRPSMKSYDGSINDYVEINTAAKLANPIANNEGYYIFVRGDRGILVGGLGTTILRVKGKIRTGDQIFTVPAYVGTSAGFLSFGNPFPSAIDFRTIFNSSIAQSFIVWNPDSLGNNRVGKFETYIYNSGSLHFQKTPGNTVRDTIQSGEAVFIQSLTAGSITVKEADKVGGSRVVSRTAEKEDRAGVTNPSLEINLQAVATDGTSFLVDGVLMNFGDNYSNAVDNMDVRKIANSAGNLAIQKSSNKLVVERRSALQAQDSIFLSLTSAIVAAYRFEIDPSLLFNLPLNAFLIDKFSLTETPVSLTALTTVPFSITSDVGSSVPDRFMIVFRKAATLPLPVSFTSISAEKNADKTNTVKWICANEIYTRNYFIESSATGTNFTTIGTTAATGNNSNNALYSFVDATPFARISYYRVKAISADGQVHYSAIVKVADKAVKPQFTVQPNPVINKTLHINFDNLQGNYTMELVTKQGVTVFNKKVTVSTASEVKTIIVGEVAAGVYDVLIMDANGKQLAQTIFIQ